MFLPLGAEQSVTECWAAFAKFGQRQISIGSMSPDCRVVCHITDEIVVKQNQRRVRDRTVTVSPPSPCLQPSPWQHG